MSDCPTTEQFKAYFTAFIDAPLRTHLTRTISSTSTSEPYWTGVWNGSSWSGERHVAKLVSVSVSVNKEGKIVANALCAVEDISASTASRAPLRAKTILSPLTPPKPPVFRFGTPFRV